MIPLLGVLVGAAAADEKGLLGTKVSYKETQERIFMRVFELQARNHRRDLFWPYENALSGGHDFGVDLQINDATSKQYDIEGKRFRLIYGHQSSESFYFEAKLGAHYYEADARSSSRDLTVEHTNPVGELKLQHKHAKGRHEVYGIYDNLYTLLQLPAGVSQNLRYLSLGYRGTYRFTKKHELTGRVLQRFYSDDNRRLEVNASSMHKLADHELFPWLGFGFSYLDTDKSRPGYWTPRSQTSFGPRISWSYWHSELFSVGIFSDINYYYDSSSKDSGIGHYTAMMFWLGNRNKLHGILELVRMDSAQNNSSGWFENDIMLSFNYPL